MKYEVEITRIGYSSLTFEIEADNKKQAEELALKESYNTGFDEYNVDYKVEGATPIK